MELEKSALEEREVDIEEFNQILEEFREESNLTSPQATVFILTNKYGLSNKEIAVASPIEEGTVRSHRQRAKEKIEDARDTVGVDDRWVST